MVPDPSLSRRRVLVGVAGGVGLGGGLTAAVGATRPTALPNRVTDWLVNRYPTPDAASSHWQPTVTEAHARDAVSLLADTEDEALALWDEIEPDDRGPRPRGSGGWRETAEASLADGKYNDALSEAMYGMQFAGEALGMARAERGESDLDVLAERSQAIFDRIDAVVEDLDTYPVAEPARDLAWYVRIELELQSAHYHARWSEFEDVRTDDAAPDASEYEPRDIGEITSGILQAEIAVESAEQYRDRLWELHESAATEPYDEHLHRVRDEFWDDLETMPTRDEAESRYIDEDVETYGPYEFAHSRLAQWCLPAAVTPPWEHPIREDFLAASVLGAARGLGDRRAYEAAVDVLVVTPDHEDLDPGHVLDEKRRARSTHQSVIGSNPSPFLALLSERAIEDIRVADIRREWDDSDERGAWTPWRERTQSYLYALIGRKKLEAYPDVYETVVDG